MLPPDPLTPIALNTETPPDTDSDVSNLQCESVMPKVSALRSKATPRWRSCAAFFSTTAMSMLSGYA